MKKVYFLLLTVLFAAISQAQVASNYNFAATSGTYTPISVGGGATLLSSGSGMDDATFSITLPFTFTYDGQAYTQVWVSENGFVAFGATDPGTTNRSIISSTYAGRAVAGFSGDLGGVSASSSLMVQTIGAASNRKFIAQWTAVGQFLGTQNYNFQIILSEAGGIAANQTLQAVYSALTTTASNTDQVGLRGLTNADFNNRKNTVSLNWTSPEAGTLNSDLMTTSTTIFPASGQTYTWTPLAACTTPAAQPTGLVLTPFSTSQINGSFTATTADGYLTVRYPTGAATTPPVNGTTYVANTNLGLGKVVSASAATTFNATGLAPSTTYDFYVYSYNNLVCSGAPAYKLTTPLSGTSTTLACTGLAAGTYTVGPTGTYTSLTAVSALLSSGTLGPVIFELQSTYLPAVETFPITFSASACPLIGGVTIRPQTGAVGLSVTSANATGTINFDGGSTITFDGRAGGAGPSQLTISNTNLTGYAIQFINSARFNTFKYCTISGTNSGTASGVVFFNNAVGLTTGNSNNTIDNCELRDGATTPTNLIYCSGNITDYASGNNNNTVSNCLVHDWFNATSTTLSAAINMVGGGSDWTITGNSFYQTATRTFTMLTATDEGAIAITTTFGYNFTITGNFIGGTAPLCGGAPWTYTATTGTPTPKMIRLTAAVGPTSTISGNTLQNFSLTTATINNLSGLISHASGNANITNNTLGSQSATGNVTFTTTNASVGIFYLPLAFGLGAVPCNVSVTNNNIGGITCANSSTGGISFRVIYTQAVAGSQITVSNNFIGGTVANSLQQLTNNIFHAILVLNPTVGGVYTNNTIRNMTLTNAGVTGSLVGVNVQASGGGHIITGNQVFNLTSNATNVAINNAASVVGITMTGSVVGGTNISNNTIYNLTNTNATVAGWINGIYVATGLFPQPNTIIANNNIHSINLASAVSGTGLVGIFLPNVGNGQVYNNMVRLGIDASGASESNGLQINGIYKVSTGTMNVYHNTVYIGGSGVASGTQNTYAYRRGATGTAPVGIVDTVMNNIFYNARSNASGTGKHYAIFTNAATSLFSNYNDLLANGTGGVLGLNVATDYATLPLWRTATNQDWNSINADPILVNPTGTSVTGDLHIGAGATPIDQAGYNLPLVSTDIDAQTRSTLTPVDLGADAGNFTVSDIAPPVIYLTPLLINTCSTGDRVVSGINITDATGVPIAGGLRPRIYYRKNAVAFSFAQSQPGTLTSGSATNGTWSFTIVAADMGGLAAADVVSYYIIAQDIVGTPNIASNFGGAVATDVNTVITHPTTPNTYTVTGVSLGGTFTVGAAGVYPTLTAAVAAYNTACLTSAVTFSLIDVNYPGETFPITINANPYANSTNTLTIKPTLAATTITGTSATGLIVLNGADWVTINGSISATANTICPPVAATRDLTLTNTNASTTSAVIWLQTSATLDAATNNSVRNINIVGSGNTATLVGIGCGSNVIGIASLGQGNHNNSYINNNISKTQYGIYSQGSSLGNKNQGTVINQNLINTVAPNNTARGGVFVGFENNISISGNNISEIALASSPDVFGITLGTISISTSTFTGNEVSNAVVTKNNIGSVRNTGTFSACGIFVAPAITGTNLISNNFVNGVSANGTAGDFSVGIYTGGGFGSITSIYNNTVNMTSLPANTGSSDKSFALAIQGANPMVNLRNNIFSNTQNNGSGNNYAVAFGYVPFSNLIADHNDYYVAAGATFFIGGTASISAPTNQLTLINLQAVTGTNGTSQNVLPVFVSATDMHLSNAAGANWCLNNTGITIAAVTDDIDCQARNNPPDIGADEFIATGSDIATPASQTICSGGTANIVFSGTATSYTWIRDNPGITGTIGNFGPGNVSGTLINNGTAPVVVTFTVTPLDASGCPGPSFSATVTVNPTATVNAVANQTLCNGAATAAVSFSSPTTGGTIVYNWTNSAPSIGLAAIGAGNIASFTATNVTTAPVVATITVTPAYTNGVTCNGTPLIFTITVNPTATVNAVANQTLCNGASTTAVNFSSPTTGGTIVYNWTNTAPSIGLAAIGAGDIASFTATNATTAPVVATITVTPAYTNGVTCNGTPLIFTFTVNPTATVNAVANQTVCNGAPTTAVSFSSPTTGGTIVYNWTNSAPSIGLAAIGAGNIASFTATNATAAPVTATITVTPAYTNGVTCNGTPLVFTITVNPTPTVVQPADQIVCNGAPTAPVVFSGTPAGSNAAFSVSSSSNQLYTISTSTYAITTQVTATLAGFTVLGMNSIDYDPTSSQYYVIIKVGNAANQRRLGVINTTTGVITDKGAFGDKFSCITFAPDGRLWGVTGNGGTCSECLYSINKINAVPTFIRNLGNGADGEIICFNPADNFLYHWSGNATVVYEKMDVTLYNITAIGTYSAGIGSGEVFGAKINPANGDFIINDINNFVERWNTLGPVSTLGNTVPQLRGLMAAPGVVFNWTNNTPSIGLAASGTGNIASFTATNAGTAPVVATVTVTPSYTNGGTTCLGVPKTFTYTVNPTATVTAVSNQSVCHNSPTAAITFSSPATGGTIVYNWTNSDPSIGLAASGMGNIASFIANNPGLVDVVATITVTPTYTNGVSCVGTPMIFTITVKPLPTISGALTQPTTCVSFNGAISLTLTGPGGPYTFAWTGPSVNPTSQNQINLPIGLFGVTVTAANGCSASSSFTLLGPGGCSICPTMGPITTNPTPAVCLGQSTTIQVTGLTNMGITYGITFKYASTSTLITDPYTQGTVIATVPNGSLTAGGTTATTSFIFPATGNWQVYAILNPTPLDPTCRTSVVTFITVNPLPTISLGANPVVCAGTTSASISYAASFTPTTYSLVWSVAANGQGFTNITNAVLPASPIPLVIPAGAIAGTYTGTITVTNANGCTSSSGQSFNVIINPIPNVVGVVNQSVCNGATTSAITFTGAVGGTVYTWSNNTPSIGLGGSGTGNIAPFVATNPGTTPVTATITVTTSYTNAGVTCTGNSTSFTITVAPTATVNAVPNQVVCNNGTTLPVNFTGTANSINWTNNTPSIGLAASGIGDIAAFTATNATNAPVVATVTVTPSIDNFAYITNFGSNNLMVVKTATNAVVSTITTGTNPQGVVISRDWKTVYVTNVNGSSISVYNAASNTVIATLPTPTIPRGMAITPDGSRIYLACEGNDAVSVINTATNTITATILVGIDPFGVAITPDGSRAYVCNKNSANVSVINTATNTVMATIGGVGTGPRGISITPDGSRVYVANLASNNVSVISTVSNTVIATVAVGTGPLGILAGADGTKVYVANQNTNDVSVISTATNTVTATFGVPTLPFGVAENLDGSRLYVTGSGNSLVSVVNTATNTILTTIPVGINTATVGKFVSTAPVVSCLGTPKTFTYTVNPTPVVNAVANQVVCNNSPTAAVNFSSPTTGGTIVYNWTNNLPSIGLAASGVGNIPSFIALNPAPGQVTATITVTPTYTNGGVSCTGAPITFTIIVNPTPVLSTPLTNSVVCNGTAMPLLALFGPSVGTIFNWTCNQSSIGIAAVGQGDIPAYTATNVGAAPVVATVTITPSLTLNGVTCLGVPRSFTVTVNPTPSVNAVANQTVCNGQATAAITFTGTVTNTVYNWTNSNTSIGLTNGGAGNIGSFTAINNSGVVQTATITVTPVFTNAGVTCVGTAITFTITVNPNASVNGVGNQTVCAGSATAAVNFTGSPVGATYSWTNNNTAIGLAASGTGNIASFTATNGTAAPISGTITVTSGNGTCTGTSTSFTITVNPTATVNVVANQTVCANSNTAAVTFTSPTAGTTFAWTNSDPTIGLGANGIGNIASFTAINVTLLPRTATITVTPTSTFGGVTCVGTPQTFTITVNPAANIIATNVPIRVCLTDTIVILKATPTGGVWTGPGVSGNTFNAATAGVGVKNITYTVASGAGCVAMFNTNITVNDCLERHNIFANAIWIYPNPSSGKFNIRFLSDIYKEFDMEVIDVLGQIVWRQHFMDMRFGRIVPIDIRRLPSATYWLRVYNTQDKASFPIVIQH